MASSITTVTITLAGIVNDVPRTYASVYTLTAGEGTRLFEFIAAEFGKNEDGTARSAQATVNALADDAMSLLARRASHYFRELAERAAAAIAYVRT